MNRRVLDFRRGLDVSFVVRSLERNCLRLSTIEGK